MFLFFSQFIFCDDTCTNTGTPNNLQDIYREESSSSSEGDCLFSVATKKWHKCIIDSDYGTTKMYYAITSGGECVFVDSCKMIDNYIMTVYGTHECIESCAKIHDDLRGSFIQYGDFCVHVSSKDSLLSSDLPTSDYELIPINGYQILKCNKAEHSTLINRAKFTKCVEGKYCPNNYYDYEEHKCLEELETCEQFKKKEIKRENNNDKIECVSQCIDEEYYYESSDGKQCLKSCEGDELYYYYNGTQRPLQCRNNCSSDYIQIKQDSPKLCVKECESGHIFIDSNGNKICNLTITTTLCTDKNLKKYSNYCLNKCNDTLELFGIETFQNDDTNNECIDNCFQLSDNNKYKKRANKTDEDNMCVDCKYHNDNDNNLFIYNLECISSCPDTAEYHYKIKYADNSYSIECVSKCPNGYYLNGYECVEKCNDIEDTTNLYVNDSNVCVECTKDEGFHLYYDDSEESNQNILKRCYSKCPPDYLFHNYNDNICYSIKDTNKEFLNCFERKETAISTPTTTNAFVFPYFKIDDPYTCYPSCNETVDYKNEIEEYHCSNEFNCPDYYYTINSVKKCIEENYLRACKERDLMYLRGRECVAQCNETEYRSLPVEGNIFQGLKDLGKCCALKEDCGNKFYCNCERNLLRDSCPYKRIKNKDQNNIISSSGGNCVMECPNEYPYESIDGTICNDTNYFQYYYKIDNKFKLVENCKDINRYHINNSYECIQLEECKIDNNYLYYDDENVCYYSCLDLPNKYAFNSSYHKSQQKCMPSCPQGYYYLDNEFICLDKCDLDQGLFYKYYENSEDSQNNQNNLCVEKCEDNQYVLNENECVKECPPYMFINTTLIKAGSKYLTINKCVDTCPAEAKFREEDGRKCLMECSSEGKKYKYGLMCVEKCPEGFYIEGNECKTSCTEYFIKNYLDTEQTKYNFQCIQVCDNYTLSTKECIEKCPLGENYIGKNKQCKPACEEEDGIYYEKREEAAQEGINYIIYACVKNITNMSIGNYIVDGTSQIVDQCPTDHPYLSVGERRCYQLCTKSIYYPFTAEYDNGTKICATECKESKKYYGEDKICKTQCDNNTFYIINDEDNSCVSKCDINSNYKFKTYKDGKYHCSLQCDTEQPKYTTSDYICYKDCPAPYNYEYKNECLLKCPENLFSDFVSHNENENEDKYKCTDKCENDNRLHYYRTDLKCIESCKNEDYEIEGTYECSPICEEINSVKYHYYINTNGDKTIKQCVLNCPEAKPFLREDNQCHDSCNVISFNYYGEDKVCQDRCKDEYKIIIEEGEQTIFPCVKNCNSSYFEDINKYCISSCDYSYSGNKYYNPIEKKCLPSCNKTLYYTQGYECVSSCSEDYFIDDRTCKEICPDEKRYFVGNYTHGEMNVLQNECLYKCPDNYNFVTTKTKRINEVDHTLYICLGSCDYYINKEGNNECVESCEEPNSFYEIDNYGRKSCLSKCPEYAQYFYKADGQVSNIKCLKQCPENTYKEVNSNQCVEIEKCSTKAVDYEEKKCVYGCKNSQYWNKTKFENGGTSIEVTICLNKCIYEFGSYLSIGNECVKKCPEGLVVNYVDNTCICPNLFVIINGDKSECLDSSITECGKDTTYQDYKYRIANSNQCTQSCFGVLSTNEDLCYSSYNNCSHIPNTYIVSEGGNIKCDCQYNYYYIKDSENRQRKICLGENDECPIPYTLLNVSNKECIQTCGDYKQLDYKCFKECPDKTSYDENTKLCVYSNNWYVDENNGNIFLPQDAPCTPQYPYRIDETKQCVNNCSNTKYSYIYKDICYSSCKTPSDKFEISLSRVKPREFSKYYTIASYECQCDNKWYKDIKEDIICTSNNECPEGYNYIVKETKECVKSCPKDYPYNFNLECFESCENAKNSYQYPVKKVDDSFECSCENLWNRNENTVVCLTDVNCGAEELLIWETKECIKGEGCPEDAPLKYNKVCYKDGNCPENTKPNINGNECICKNLWYTQSTGNKYCLLESECPFETHPNLIYSTKECIPGECPSELKSFNNTCYESCPPGTIEEEGKNECICDQQIGFWYIEEEKNKKPKRICGLDQCPVGMEYWNNRTKECLSKSCGEYKLYEYNKICYENQCPNPTVSENPDTNPYECVTKKYSTSTNISQTYNYIKEEIIDLYKTIPDGGLIYNNFNATMQLYGIKSTSIQKAKDTVVRSGLSYIDIGGCSKKVFKNNQMDEKEDDIVVLKFDLENQKKKSLINPVEYEFVSSKTGKKLDMSVCTKNDVVISYSLFDILNNFRRGKIRNIEEIQNDEEFDNILAKIQKQYEKAKQIKSEYDIDTFNINSSLYEDICMTFQIKGKDLILEDRVENFYPEYSLCEENCTYSHIDFELERIYCNCPLKTDFDLSREHKFVLNMNNSDDIINRQKGPTNFAVMKCMSRLKESESFNKNAGFFFTLIIIIFQIILLFITIFYNYRNLKTKINKNSIINNSDDDIEKEINIEAIEVGHKKNISKKRVNNIKNDVNIKTSERPLNSPPPKKRDLKLDKITSTDMKLKNKALEGKEKEKEKEKIYNDGNETINELSENNNEDDFSDDSISKDYFTGILDSVRNEQKLLRIKFDSAIQNDQSDIFIMILTEIFDKIYLIKTICLLSKYDMFSIYFSLYLLYHLLLLSFVTCFYDIKTIHNIYIMEDYPTLSHDLGYGLLSCLIVWIIYKIFLCILNNDEIIKKYIKKRIDSSNDSENVRKNNRKINDLLCSIKTGMIVYFALQFILAVVCFLYITVFCAVYVGTKKKIFKTYGIALLEVLIIKIIYGIILGIIRKVGLSKQNAIAYNIAYYLDKFLH